MIRVLIAGRGALAVRTGKLVTMLAAANALEAKVECLCVANDSGRASWMPSLRAAAVQHRWLVHSAVSEANLSVSDILISLQFDKVIDVRDLRGARAYNLHFSPLPKYRGSLSCYWPIRHSDRTAGLTLHVLTERLDAGPIIASRSIELPPFYTAYDLYQAFHAHGFELLRENLADLLRGTCESVNQDDNLATYFPRKSVDFTDLDFSDFEGPAEAVRDRCRALIFPPMQCPTFHGRSIVQCYAVDAWKGIQAVAGTVLAELPDEALVACDDGMVCLEFA